MAEDPESFERSISSSVSAADPKMAYFRLQATHQGQAVPLVNEKGRDLQSD